MKVVSFVTQKGGSGKSTLAISCAVAAMEAGFCPLLVDMDQQGTAEAWFQDREKADPKLIRAGSAELPKALELARANRFDLVILDTPGRDEPGQAAAIKLSDLCLVPCRPTPGDMKATPPTADTIRRLGKSAAFVLNQTPPRSFRIAEAKKGLAVLGMVAPVHIVARNAFQDAQGAGLGVTEFEPDGKAAEEIKALWAWIAGRLEKMPS
jgi:chromosome partitioning protein